MRDHLYTAAKLVGLFCIVGLVGCASPPGDESSRMWVSIGGALENFETDESFCADEAAGSAEVIIDEPLFAVCMFERGWRESHGEDPRLAAVAPVDAVRSKVNVRAHPSKSGEILAALAAGERAQLLGREGDWYHVRMPDGEEGYVSARWTAPLD